MQSLNPECIEIVRLGNEAISQAYFTGLVIGAAIMGIGLIGGTVFLRWYNGRTR